jgi:AcrR family transcriptional regulator
MARVIKTAEERQAEILDAAERLFLERGYEATTVNDLLAAVGLSKGAFYHHFTSKDDVLQALVWRMADEGMARLAPLLERTDLSPLAKLRALFIDGQQFRKEHVATLRPFLAVFFREENLRLRMRRTAEMIERAAPLVGRVIEAGAQSGEFDVDEPEETARLLFHMGASVHEAFAEALRRVATDRPAALALLRRRVAGYERAFERLLGIPKHSIVVADDELLELFLPPAH